ncbi:hypothetical protein [Muricoccus radiodurans]|uniref:hypothetical protein n=1 Tax=Muricoccus radiodurans TaxID=2231721 RepID=UPI003CF4906C
MMLMKRPRRLQLAPPDLESAILAALEKIVSRVRPEDRAATFRQLREELEQSLAEAPMSGDVVDGIAFRARLAALFAQGIDRADES